MMSHISDDMSVDRFEKILEGTSVSTAFVMKPMYSHSIVLSIEN